MTDNDAQAEDGEPQIVDVTITAPDADWLRQHCAMLIEKRLAASANIIPAIDSIYRWQDEVHHTTEAYAILHTQIACFNTIARMTRKEHPYNTVHILAKLVRRSESSYRRWVFESTYADSSRT